MKKLNDAKRNKDEANVTEIRTKIAKSLQQEFQKGDGTKCTNEPTMLIRNEICDRFYKDKGVYYDKCNFINIRFKARKFLHLLLHRRIWKII